MVVSCHAGAKKSLLSEKPKYLDEAKMDAFRPPKQDRATAMGIVQLNMPNVWSANVWRQSKERALNIGPSFVILLLISMISEQRQALLNCPPSALSRPIPHTVEVE